ncbi:MAG: hypothetical protein Q7U36_03805 [bacterium]|jgi:hypothetical protein|nr:hypothetical protein [bacterium]
MDNNLDQEKIKKEIDKALEEAESKMSPQEKLEFLRELNNWIESFNQNFADLKKMTEEEEKLKEVREKL